MKERWTEKRKKEILDSRIGTTQILVDAIQQSKIRPKIFISASAVGIYPQTDHEPSPVFDESWNVQIDPNDWAAYLVNEWEKTFFSGMKAIPETRIAVLRMGIVLSSHGGAMMDMLTPFKMGLGGRMASGKQYWPWIHLDDAMGIYKYIMENESIEGFGKVEGVFNGVAPHKTTNEEFTKTLGKVLNRPTLLPVPEFALKLAFQDRAQLLSNGVKVEPKRTLQMGYKFKFDTLSKALSEVAHK